MTSVPQLLASLRCHCAPRLAWEIAYARSLAPLGRVKLSAGTAQNSPLKAMPSSPSLTQAQYKFILWLRLNAWLNPSIERTLDAHPMSIADLPNLGPKSQQMLALAGVTSVEQLQSLGSVATYVLVKRSGGNPSLNLLWALEGVLTGLPWQVVARDHRTSLLLALDDYEQQG